MIEESKKVSHTVKVKYKLNKLFSIILNIESSQRGYLLTRDNSFLPPVTSARKTIDLQLEHIEQLIRDNPRQQLNLKTLKATIYKRIDYLNTIVSDSKSSLINKQRFLNGKELMNEVIAQINIMVREEDRLLSIGTISMAQSSNLSPIYSIVLIISAIIILVMSYLRIIQELNTSKNLKLNIEQSKNELEKSYEQLLVKTEQEEKRSLDLINAINELNLSEIRLRNSLKEVSDYKDILDETAIVSLSDRNGIIRKINANFCKISKYNEKELIGQQFSILNSSYHSKEYIAGIWTKITNGKIWKGEFKNKAKDGSIYWVETTLVPFLDENERPYQFLSISTDITDLKNSEEELYKVNADLASQNEEKEQRASELIIANKELAFQLEEKEKRASELIEINKELESFNYISSHDLQEPLRHIQSFASRIIVDEKDHLSDKGKVYFEKIINAANRMQFLLTDLLTYSRTATDDRIFETIDLNNIVNEIKLEFKETIVEKNAIIEVKDLCEVHVIQFQFHQLMYNLIGNALKFSKTDIPPHIKVSGKIVVQSEVENVSLLPNIKYCHITIDDNGIGFEPQYENKIFELFQRLNDKQKIAGTGIGLAIVKKIVENHKGFIKATGVINHGARFDVYVPLV
jgi:PAS domain S-box-containing protein